MKKWKKLLKANIICEIKYPNELANMVLVKKIQRQMENVCYLPINWRKRPGTWCYVFMDAFSEYNKIKMNPGDIPKNSFYHLVGSVLLWNDALRPNNVRATYQRMMNAVFWKSCRKGTWSPYVDDMIARSEKVLNHIKNLKEWFENLRKNNMKLNLDKCAFWVSWSATGA